MAAILASEEARTSKRTLRQIRIDEIEYSYQLDEYGDACIVKCKAQADCVQIPDALGGHPVVALGDTSFSGLTSVRRISCPAHLRSIGRRAFENCRNLEEITFNESLETIGAEAFFLCGALDVLRLPRSLRKLGTNVAGGKSSNLPFMQGSSIEIRTAAIQIAPNSPYLFSDADGLIYERTEDGLVLIDGTRFAGETLIPHPDTFAIGAQALAQNQHICRALLPQGCTRIEAEAFRGCIRLSEIQLPDSLQEIQQGVFSCTALRSIAIPRNCIRMHATALVTGPVVPGYPAQHYESKLHSIVVDKANPRYRMIGPMLCRKVCDKSGQARDLWEKLEDSFCLICECSDEPLAEDTPLEAVLCTARADEVALPANVLEILPTAFAGTTRIGHLRLHQNTRLPEGTPLLPNGHLGRITIELATPIDGREALELALPADNRRPTLIAQCLSGPAISIEELTAAYDAAVTAEADRLAQAQHMVSRLAEPLLLTQESRRAFARAVEENLDCICLHFGARSYWRGFEELATAGILGRSEVSHAITVLTEHCDAPAAGYLLDMQRRRFGQSSWDYDL